MRRSGLRLLALIWAGVVWLPMSGFAAQQEGSTGMAPAVAAQAGRAVTESDVYCAGFFTRRPIEQSLLVLGSEDGEFKNEMADRDFIYLNRGQGWVQPDSQYILVRPVKDDNSREPFPGQRELVAGLGTLYAEVARVRVRVVHEGSATAEIVSACEPVLAGDFALPFQARPIPPSRSQAVVDRFAPFSGKAVGLIAAAKGFQRTVGTGEIVYLNLGNRDGVQAGSYLRIFQTQAQRENDVFEQAARNYLTKGMGGVQIGRRMTAAERASLPRIVLGEVLLLSVEEGSSTGIITFSRAEVSPGNAVELE